jgi:AcrR family transcriptional regulator
MNLDSVMNRASLKAIPGNRFARRRARTRDELLRAATRVLASKGLHDTKIADIAAAADVGVGTFYLHFATKDALFDAVVDDTVRRLKQAIDAARATSEDPIERTRASNVAFCRFAADNREVFKAVFGHAAAFNDVIRRAQTLFATDIEETIRDGVARGVFIAVAPAVAAQAVIGMATQILSWWTEQDSVPIERVEETVSRLALRGLVATPAETSRQGG